MLRHNPMMAVITVLCFSKRGRAAVIDCPNVAELRPQVQPRCLDKAVLARNARHQKNTCPENLPIPCPKHNSHNRWFWRGCGVWGQPWALPSYNSSGVVKVIRGAFSRGGKLPAKGQRSWGQDQHELGGNHYLLMNALVFPRPPNLPLMVMGMGCGLGRVHGEKEHDTQAHAHSSCTSNE